jgi:pimeloyl-[acyl-carrier protein] synthase
MFLLQDQSELSLLDFENLLSADAFYDDPYPVYKLLRENEPIYWSDSWNCWLVTRYEDANTILRNASQFSNTNRFSNLIGTIAASTEQRLEILDEHMKLGIANTDRPEHTRLRTLTGRGFHPRHVASLEEYVQTVVDRLLDEIETHEFDVVARIARPLPTVIIADQLGVATREHALFAGLIDATTFHGRGSDIGQRAHGAVHALRSLEDWLLPLIQARRAVPRDDLLSRLVAAEEDGGLLDDRELVTSCIVLVRAGQLTTQGLIGNGILALLNHHPQWDKPVENPDMTGPAVEEILRYDTSFLRTLRRATTDVHIGGKTFRQNELVSVMLGAANRDPQRFDDPDVFDISREGAAHLGFGVGTHFCLGAPLARLEFATLLRALTERWPQLRLATSGIGRERDNVNRHVCELRVATS